MFFSMADTLLKKFGPGGANFLPVHGLSRVAQFRTLGNGGGASSCADPKGPAYN